MVLVIFQFGGEYINTGNTYTDWPKWITALCSILTLFLAFKIWKNYDVKKHFVKKQLDTVFDLYASISNTRIRIEAHTKNTMKAETFYLGDIISLLGDIDRQVFLTTTPILIDVRILSDVSFMKFIENPFTPKAIVTELEKFRVKFKSGEEPLEGNYAIMEIAYLPEQEPKNYLRHLLEVKGETYNSFGNYLSQAFTVKNAIQTWLKKFEVYDMNLRHDRRIRIHGVSLHSQDEKQTH